MFADRPDSDSYKRYNITIQDPAGHEVLRQHTDNGKIVVHLEAINSGIYILRISTATGDRYTRKVIK